MTIADVESIQQPATAEHYRRAIGRFASGVTIVMTVSGDQLHGATASAVCSLSSEPAMLVICLNKTSGTGRAVRESGRLTVNVLTEQQAALASRFGSRKPDRFGNVALDWTHDGIPKLRDNLVTLECNVEIAVDAATHVVFLCAVDRVEIRDGKPLTYFRGRFGSFAAADDTSLGDRLLATLRAKPDHHHDVVDLARVLDVQCASVAQALNDLRARGVVAESVGEYRAVNEPSETSPEDHS